MESWLQTLTSLFAWLGGIALVTTPVWGPLVKRYYDHHLEKAAARHGERAALARTIHNRVVDVADALRPVHRLAVPDPRGLDRTDRALDALCECTKRDGMFLLAPALNEAVVNITWGLIEVRDLVVEAVDAEARGNPCDREDVLKVAKRVLKEKVQTPYDSVLAELRKLT